MLDVKMPRRSGLRALMLSVVLVFAFAAMGLFRDDVDLLGTADHTVVASPDKSLDIYAPGDPRTPSQGVVGTLWFGAEWRYYGWPLAFCARFTPSARFKPTSSTGAAVTRERIDEMTLPHLRRLLKSASAVGHPELCAAATRQVTSMSPEWIVSWPLAFRSAGVLTTMGIAIFVVAYVLDRWWWAAHVRRSQRESRCPACGYSLEGIGSAACPECGSAIVTPVGSSS